MMIGMIFLVAFSAFFAQTYFVTSSGTDGSSCGAQGNPCASISQVITNHPGASFTISVSSGTYATNPINLTNGATVVIQGTGNPAITATRISSGQEWINVTLNLTGSGPFVVLEAETDTAILTNVIIIMSGFFGDVFVVNGGSVVMTNVTLDGANFDGYFIIDESVGVVTNISVIGSTFNNLTIGEDGAVLVFDASGTANLLIETSSFTSIQTGYVCFGFWAEDSNQALTISNSVFGNTYTYLPSVYIENDNGLVVVVENTSWNVANAGFVCGALEILGPDNGVDNPFTLFNVTFSNCNGPYVGALLVAYNSMNILNSSFSGNRGQIASDVVQGLDGVTSNMSETITNSYSSSPLPKGLVWNIDKGAYIDISYQLPNPSNVQTVALSREKITAASRFNDKQKENGQEE